MPVPSHFRGISMAAPLAASALVAATSSAPLLQSSEAPLTSFFPLPPSTDGLALASDQPAHPFGSAGTVFQEFPPTLSLRLDSSFHPLHRLPRPLLPCQHPSLHIPSTVADLSVDRTPSQKWAPPHVSDVSLSARVAFPAYVHTHTAPGWQPGAARAQAGRAVGSGENLPQLGQVGQNGQPAAPLHQWHRKADAAGQEQKIGDKETVQKRIRDKGQGVEEDGDYSEGALPPHSDTAVVLLGWLGAKQRHLRRYAEWYTSQGMDAITFVIPVSDLVSIQAAENGLRHVDNLVAELESWLYEDEDESGQRRKVPHRHLVFHTFSNTGWLSYGSVLQRLRDRHGSEGVEEMIRGCVVDSAPNLHLDPEVFSAGFTAALLGKRSSSARVGPGVVHAGEVHPRADTQAQAHRFGPLRGASPWEASAQASEMPRNIEEGEKGGATGPETAKEAEGVERRKRYVGTISAEAGHAMSADDVDALLIRVGEKGVRSAADSGPDGERGVSDAQHMSNLEWTLRAFLTQFFSVVLRIPHLRRVLEGLTSTLEMEQPPCPQLYIYSTADSVIPASDVEEFIRLQRAKGVPVLARRFTDSPHVDHFRTFPDVYTRDLRSFLEECGLLPK